MSDPSTLAGFFLLGAAVALIGLLIVAVSRLASGRLPRAVPVQFLPPDAGNLFEHGLALRADRRVFTAALLHLTVSGRARISHLTTGSRAVAVQILAGAALSPEERSFVAALQPRQMRPGAERRYLQGLQRLGLTVASPAEAPGVILLRGRGTFRRHRRRQLTALLNRFRRQLNEDGYTHRWANSVHLVLLSLLFLITAAAALLLGFGATLNGEWLGLVVVLLDLGVVFWVLTLAPPPLLRFTERGHELRRELAGLRHYIGQTEQRRIALHQSPQGALRTPAGGLTPGGQALGLAPVPNTDPVTQSGLDRYVLTERLLPYAVLFGQEKQWAHELRQFGGTGDVDQSLGAIGSTLTGVVAVLEVLAVITQLFRAVGVIVSLFGRH